MVELRPATEQDVRKFATWRYDPPYDVYDVDMTPDEAVAYFLEPGIRCHALFDGSVMVGYCTFGPDAQVSGGDYDADGIDIGLGVKPELTGAGKGNRFVTATINSRPRKILGWRTPAEAFDEHLRSPQQAGVATTG